MKMPPQPLAVFKTDAFNAQPMSLATGFPRNCGYATKSKMDRRAASGASTHGSGRRGFTLIEAMIAITMTLIIMLALAQGFKRLSDDISQGRARLALSDQLRSVSEVLRNDLASLTVDPDPTTPNNKLGYFMYYDGPVTDYTAATLPINSPATASAMLQANAQPTDPVPTTEQRLSASKYGDFDDIVSFTAKSDGDYFKGRVPLAIVKGAAAYRAAVAAGTPNNISYNPPIEDWVNTVVVASQFAEISYFMVPQLDDANPFLGQDVPNIIDTDTNASRGLSDYTDTLNGIDLLPNDVGNAIPDKFVLCRRVLLIVPELNIIYPTNYSIAPGQSGLYFDDNINTSEIDSFNRRLFADATNGSYRTTMQHAHQRCDLSVHRVRTASPPDGRVPVGGNSLDDLASPFNRFGHTMRSIGGSDTTMPILALTSPIGIQQYSVRNTVDLSNLPEAGFMRPEYLRHNFSVNASAGVTNDEGLSGSEFFALNCIAFDVKGFDPSVRTLYNFGSDKLPGNGPNLTSGILGASGTDDLVLTPSDPGYFLPFIDADYSAFSLQQLTASTGTFVDLGWALKYPPAISTALADPDVLATSLSWIQRVGASVGFSTNAFKSGRFRLSSSTIADIFQPTFDSYIDEFENDGFNQFNAAFGTTFLLGRDYLQGTAPPTTLPGGADLAVNGLDDALVDVAALANGIVDDIDERDTLPPINFAMPAIQATIRLEDKQAGVIQQIAVTQSLVNP